jgi:membrane protease YdiL (CAAX protease family)
MVVVNVGFDWLNSALGRPIVPDVMAELYWNNPFIPAFWFAVIVCAPLSEEFLFRGLMHEGLRHSWMGNVGAVLVPSALWAVVHLQYDWYGIGVIFVNGLVLGAARIHTGSLHVPIIMHAVTNLVATVQIAMRV